MLDKNALRLIWKLKNLSKILLIVFPPPTSYLRIWSHLVKKSLMENFIFYAVIIKINFH